MDLSSAADALLDVVASQTGVRTRSQSRTRESSLSEPPPSPAPPTTYIGSRRRVRFEEEEEDIGEGPSTTTPRSTRGKAPERLVDQQQLPESTPRRATTKRKPSTQQPQPPSKRVSAVREPLSNAANTLGKKRTSNTSKKTKIQALTAKNRPAKPCTVPAPTTRRPSTSTNKVTKPSKVAQKAKRTLPTKKVSSNSGGIATSSAAEAPQVPIPFKLQFDSRWGHQRISDADTALANTDKGWPAVLKELDATVIPCLEGRGIALFYPWKIRALITSTAARGLRQTEAVTLVRVEANTDRWSRAMDLVRFNAATGMKDMSIIIESIWTPDGNEPAPEQPPAYDACTTTPTPTQPARSARSQRSTEQTANYMAERAVFWDAIVDKHQCPTPARCEVKARRGLACFVHRGRHFEVFLSIAARWRDAVRDGHGTLEHPSREIRKLIQRQHWSHEAELEKRRRPQNQAPNEQASPGTINHIYVNQQPQAQEQTPSTAAPCIPAPRQVSPLPPELNNTASWEAFWEAVKLAYPDWSSGFDRAKAALEEDYWNLKMLLTSSDKNLSRVVKQTGLRMTIHEELSKFVDIYKRQQRQLHSSPRSDQAPLRATTSHAEFDVQSIASSSTSSSDGVI